MGARMKLSKRQREGVRLMFGGQCAYCGKYLDGKWHADHVEPILRETVFVHGEVTTAGYTKTKATGKLYAPQNDILENIFPSCIKCNILKGSQNVEGFRSTLIYFANSIPKIDGYSHVHHLMRFGKLTIDTSPVVFWFENPNVMKRKVTA